MRRKPPPKPEPVISAEILEQAKRSISTDKLKKPEKCSVCGGESSGTDSSGPGDEPLCWVCRRLKVSAWHEIEQQMPAQE
jgi:hypothetical protein